MKEIQYFMQEQIEKNNKCNTNRKRKKIIKGIGDEIAIASNDIQNIKSKI